MHEGDDKAQYIGPEERPMRVVRFGDVVIVSPGPTPEEKARSVRESTEALARLMPHLVIPGVHIRRKPGRALYYANKHRSGTVIREIDGRKDVGLLKPDGTWYPIDDKPSLESPGSTCSDQAPQPCHQISEVCSASTGDGDCVTPPAQSTSFVRTNSISKIVELLGGARTFQHPPITVLDAHNCLVDGLPLCSVAHLTDHVPILRDAQVFEVVVGMSYRDFQRCEQRETVKLDAQQSARIWAFATVLVRSMDVFGSQANAEQWFVMPAMGLEQRRPIDFISTAVGTELIEDLLVRIAHGVYG